MANTVNDAASHVKCPDGVACPCASVMGNRLLRELLTAMGWDVPARPEAPRLVWAEALRRVEAKFGDACPLCEGPMDKPAAPEGWCAECEEIAEAD
jgi:hypothetical protein